MPLYNIMSDIRRPQIDFPQEKKTTIGVTPGAVIGALVGANIAKKKSEKLIKQRMFEEQAKINNSRPRVEGNYYSQAKNIADNLEVVFTPMSAVFVVKNNNKSFTLDTLEASEMSDQMKMAWRMKDANYFKNILLNKMFSEMQMAEQSFTKRFLKKKMDINKMINKTSSDESVLDEISNIDLFDMAYREASMFANEEFEKVASAIVSDIASECDDFNISLTLERPLSKYAGVFSNIKGALGLNTESENVKSIKRKLENPTYVMKHVKIGFFPDRVVFTVDNQLIGTLSLLDMNEDGYQNFLSQNEKYFRNYFVNSVKEQKSKIRFEKNASENEEIIVFESQDCLLNSETHPVAIYLYLTEKLGVDWINYDMAIVDEIIKRELNLDDIPETTLNKVFAIMSANQSTNAYTNAHAFEKIVISLCAKPLDILANQMETISLQDVAFAIDVLDRVTPYDDIYDNFSKEVMNYMADLLSAKEIYIYNPTKIVSSPLEPAFNINLNEKLLLAIKSKMTISSVDEVYNEKIRVDCEYIADNAMGILKSMRRIFDKNPNQEYATDLDKIVDVVISKKGIRQDLSTIIKRQVLLNVALDKILTQYEQSLLSDLNKYSINPPTGEGMLVE